MPTVLITALAFRKHGAEQVDTLRNLGYRLVENPHWKRLSEAELCELLATLDADDIVGVVAGGDRFTNAVFDRLPNLKIVSRWGIGYDAVDIAAATRHGVCVTNTPGLLGDAVADFAFGLILALARQIVGADRLMRSGGWEELSGVAVWGKTLGIVGFGNTGQALARRGRGFEMRIRVFDPHPNRDAAARLGVELVSLDDVLSSSDFVSLHAELTPTTAKMMNDRTFGLMKPGAFFVNTSRGGLVDEGALIRALDSGRLAGAALDAHTKEPPPPDYPFLSRPDVILTPHIAFSTEQSIAAVNRAVLANLLDGMNGKRPRFLVNPDVWKDADEARSQ
jgi:phosphoglycerate dehydrogenase-like enzyme